VAFCAHVSGSWDAAEDLAQETLLERGAPADRLHDSDGPGSLADGYRA
jgi:DNA-directed RNA polymerase specialized sigma24 family protein